jgi:hypothetical protein
VTSVVGDLLHTLAVGTAESVGITEFAGQSVAPGAVIVAYTWGGDADMNGELNGDDYFAIDSHILQSGSVFGFQNGDFDLNGELNGDDYFVIDSNILQAQGSAPLGFDTATTQSLFSDVAIDTSSAGQLAAASQARAAAPAAGLVAVPEPGSVMLAAIGAGMLLRRTRRGRNR